MQPVQKPTRIESYESTDVGFMVSTEPATTPFWSGIQSSSRDEVRNGKWEEFGAFRSRRISGYTRPVDPHEIMRLSWCLLMPVAFFLHLPHIETT